MSISLHRPGAFLKPPDAVLFDTDNTLYAYEPAHHAGMNAVRVKANRLFGVDQHKFDDAFRIAREATKARLHGTASSHSRLLYFQKTLEIIGLRSQVLLALDLEQTYWRTFLSSARLFDGVKEFLDELRLGGVPTAIVTDLTAQIQFRKIVYFGLDHHFDYIVTSEEAGFDKPNEAPFKIAIEKMKPNGSCIWMIGDEPTNDIVGAREALSAVTLQKLHEGVKPGVGHSLPDASVFTFDALRKLFHEISNGRS